MNPLLLLTVRSLMASILIATPVFSQTSTNKIVGNDLSSLASGRSWGISYYGDTNNPALTMVWDFRKDGSVCARSPNGKKGDKCMDEGKWNVKGEVICWELTWMGEPAGFKSNCFSVTRIDQELYQLDRQEGPHTKFAPFRVLK